MEKTSLPIFAHVQKNDAKREHGGGFFFVLLTFRLHDSDIISDTLFAVNLALAFS